VSLFQHLVGGCSSKHDIHVEEEEKERKKRKKKKKKERKKPESEEASESPERALDFWLSLLVSKIDEKICLDGAANVRIRGLTPATRKRKKEEKKEIKRKKEKRKEKKKKKNIRWCIR